MKNETYLLDTHVLFFWVEKEGISPDFIDFLNKQGKKGNVLFSSVSIWEIALLKKKEWIEVSDLHRWKDDILNHSPAKMIEPTASDMIESTLLPDYHKDPFDRLLMVQAMSNNALFVTRDKTISRYTIQTFWM